MLYRTFDRGDRTLCRMFDRMFNRTFARIVDRTFGRTLSTPFDRTFGSTFHRTFDRRFDRRWWRQDSQAHDPSQARQRRRCVPGAQQHGGVQQTAVPRQLCCAQLGRLGRLLEELRRRDPQPLSLRLSQRGSWWKPLPRPEAVAVVQYEGLPRTHTHARTSAIFAIGMALTKSVSIVRIIL